MAKKKPDESEFPEDAVIESGDRDHFKVRFRNPDEEKLTASLSTSSGRQYEKRQDGSFVVHREDIAELRGHGLEVCA